jgi:hypothetical protein
MCDTFPHLLLILSIVFEGARKRHDGQLKKERGITRNRGYDWVFYIYK